MKVKVYDKNGKLRVDAMGNPVLMHAVDAINAEKSGNYKLVKEKQTFGEVKKVVITEIREKTDEDRAEDIRLKKAAIEAQKKELEQAEVALQEKLEEPEVEKVEEPKPIMEEGVPIVQEDKPKSTKKSSTKK
jgi:hypothetical protein